MWKQNFGLARMRCSAFWMPRSKLPACPEPVEGLRPASKKENSRWRSTSVTSPRNATRARRLMICFAHVSSSPRLFGRQLKILRRLGVSFENLERWGRV
jgi:hypothetical protein